jgi:hypothetical protein
VSTSKEAENATYRAIGRFVTNFAKLEYALRYFLAVEAKLDLTFFNQVMTQDFAMLCSSVSAVFSKTLQTDDDKKRLKDIVSGARKVNDIRVKVVHGKWWWADFDGGRLTHVSRQSLTESEFVGMAAFLEKEADKCRDLFVDANGLFLRLDDTPVPSEEEAIEALRAMISRFDAEGPLPSESEVAKAVIPAIRRLHADGNEYAHELGLTEPRAKDALKND